MAANEVYAWWEYPDGRRVPVPCRFVEDVEGDHYPWMGSSAVTGYRLVPVPGDDDVKLLLLRPWKCRYALDVPNDGWTGERQW